MTPNPHGELLSSFSDRNEHLRRHGPIHTPELEPAWRGVIRESGGYAWSDLWPSFGCAFPPTDSLVSRRTQPLPLRPRSHPATGVTVTDPLPRPTRNSSIRVRALQPAPLPNRVVTVSRTLQTTNGSAKLRAKPELASKIQISLNRSFFTCLVRYVGCDRRAAFPGFLFTV